MKGKFKRQSVGVNRVVLAGLIVGAALVVSSAVHAAAAEPTARKPANEATTFDPFSLKTVVAVSASSGGNVESASQPASVNRVRQPIRVPSRPCYRSAFRPGLDWKTSPGG